MEHNHTSSFSHDDHTLIIASDPSMPEDVNVALLKIGLRLSQSPNRQSQIDNRGKDFQDVGSSEQVYYHLGLHSENHFGYKRAS